MMPMDPPVVDCVVVAHAPAQGASPSTVTVESPHGTLDAVLGDDGLWLDADTYGELEPAVQRGIAAALEDADLI